MKTALTVVAVALATLAPGLAMACEGATHAAGPKKVSVGELAKLTSEKRAVPVDANSDQTRRGEGSIPGAVLLTSASQYAAEELPRDKASMLVFYCANTKCSASHAAAEKAMGYGYTNVAVLPEGIAGWKSAGQPLARPNS